MSIYLSHYGVKGQKWGVRRYQNEDGTLTPEGEKRLLEYKKQLNEELRETTNQISLRNYSKYDKQAVMLGITKEANKKANESYKRGEKIVSKMIKDGFLNKKISYDDFRKKYESQISSGYKKYCEIFKDRPHDEKDVEWYFYLITSKKDNK